MNHQGQTITTPMNKNRGLNRFSKLPDDRDPFDEVDRLSKKIDELDKLKINFDELDDELDELRLLSNKLPQHMSNITTEY